MIISNKGNNSNKRREKGIRVKTGETKPTQIIKLQAISKPLIYPIGIPYLHSRGNKNTNKMKAARKRPHHINTKRVQPTNQPIPIPTDNSFPEVIIPHYTHGRPCPRAAQ